jgi:hypothetical protein
LSDALFRFDTVVCLFGEREAQVFEPKPVFGPVGQPDDKSFLFTNDVSVFGLEEKCET